MRWVEFDGDMLRIFDFPGSSCKGAVTIYGAERVANPLGNKHSFRVFGPCSTEICFSSDSEKATEMWLYQLNLTASSRSDSNENVHDMDFCLDSPPRFKREPYTFEQIQVPTLDAMSLALSENKPCVFRRPSACFQ